jgi:nucleotide-binding universal stress UspA family protein
MYDNILVPTDGSAASRAATERAVDLAATYGATVHALSVVQPLHTLDRGYEGVLTALETNSERFVEDVAGAARAEGVETVTAIRQGPIHREILDYVEEHDVDLVVMGTHGRTGLDRYLVGSVAEKVVRLSPVPVLTVRDAEDDHEAVSTPANDA